METKKEGFLSSYLNDFKAGDIVSWIEHQKDENYQYSSIKKYGAIINFVMQSNLYSERFVWMAVILPFGEIDTKKINLNVLRKETI